MPRFRWEPAAGRPARRYAVASLLSVVWREFAGRAYEISSIISHSAMSSYHPALLQRHLCKINAAVRRMAAAPSDEIGALRRWDAAMGSAVSACALATVRSLAALAVRRAEKIEATTKAAKLADYRHALAAPGEHRTAMVRAPSRIAFRYVRGVGGWSRTPIERTTCEDDVPDADDLDADLGAVRIAGCGAGVDGVLATAPLSEQAALEHEAASWAANWAVNATYTSPDFP